VGRKDETKHKGRKSVTCYVFVSEEGEVVSGRVRTQEAAKARWRKNYSIRKF